MADLTMTARRQMRLSVLAALMGAGLGANIQSPGDWVNPPAKLPAVQLRTAGDRKDGVMHGPAEFNTTVRVEIDVRVEASTEGAAQDAIEDLCCRIECAVLTDYGVLGIVQKVVSVDTAQEITAEGKRHVGGAQMTFLFEVFEAFAPVVQSPLQPVAVDLLGVHIHNDMLGMFDATGTYADPPFPAAVTAAPRTSGPDGRDEGALDIELPQ
jgi:hypothetical protein